MYFPMGGIDETIKWYDDQCDYSRALPGLVGTWYCDFAEQLRKLKAASQPPPPPEPPPFVAVDTPPAAITEGSGYEQWFAEQRQKQKSNKTLIMLGLAGLAAFVLLKGKR